jgi:hypothetical protein
MTKIFQLSLIPHEELENYLGGSKILGLLWCRDHLF